MDISVCATKGYDLLFSIKFNSRFEDDLTKLFDIDKNKWYYSDTMSVKKLTKKMKEIQNKDLKEMIISLVKISKIRKLKKLYLFFN